MTAHPDAGLAVQPRVASGIGPFHEEDAVAVPQHDVRDELLPLRGVLGHRPVQESALLADGRPQAGQGLRIGSADAGEVAAAWDGGAREDEDALGHRASLARAPPVGPLHRVHTSLPPARCAARWEAYAPVTIGGVCARPVPDFVATGTLPNRPPGRYVSPGSCEE